MKDLVSRYLKFINNHLLITGILFLLFSAVGFFFTLKLGLSTNLSALLPSDTPSVKTAREAASRVGSTDFLIIAIEGENPLVNKQIADEAVKIIPSYIPDVVEVMARIDLEFFRKNGLLWYESSKLEDIEKQLKKVLGREKLKSMGLLVTGDAPDVEEEKLKKLISSGRSNGNIPSDLREKKGRPKELSGYFASADGKIIAVLSRVSSESVNMGKARKLVSGAQKAINHLKKKFPDVKAKIEVGGGYKNRVREYNSVMNDVFSSLLTSFGLIALIVIIFFRSLRPIPLIFIPLVSGIFITLGVTRIFGLERLNIITAFIGGILLGMGIDFGVHLCARYLEERKSGKELISSLEITLTKTGKALMTAAFTTASALFLLFFSSFRGFWEFGIIAGLGIIITLVVFMFFFPLGAIILEKYFPVKSEKSSESIPQTVGFPVKSVVFLCLSVVFSLVIIPVGIKKVSFETNFRRLSGAKSSTTIKYGKAMGDNASPGILLCDSKSDCEVLSNYFSSLLSKPLPNPDLRDFMAISQFIPEKQVKKLEIIKKIGLQLEKAKSWADDKTKTKFNTWIKYLPSRVVSENDLPEWILRRFREKNGKTGRFMYIYPARETWNALESNLFKKKFQMIKISEIPGGKKSSGVARASSSSFILVDIIDSVKKEGKTIFILALLMVFIFLLVDFRSPVSALLVTFPLIMGILWTVSLLPFLGQKLGLYNMVVVSTIVGTGIDASVHLFHSLNEKGVNPFLAFKRSSMAVGVASLTTMAGFSGMMLVKHGGLSSIGRLATVGILCTLISSMIFVPSGYFIMRWFKGEKRNV
ncbi:MAG: MMPL family transporter [Deltaproteobacteria bacterium]|nr:MMPL family transporter [Deltaproteobacteria bacterium]